MNILFYLVLAAIAILGVAALLLIFWNRIQLLRDKAKYVASEIAVENAQANDEWQDNVRIVRKNSSVAEARVEPALSDLGFNALDDLLITSDNAAQVNTTAPAPVKKSTASNELLILYVFASPEKPFVGYELLQTLLAAGLRYGNMSIFHYHQQTSNGEGPTLFSLASAVEPGIFDLGNVGAIVCPGLSLFMSTQVENPLKVFELMLETAEQLAQDLDGIVCDAQRLPLTDTKIAEYRNKIRTDTDVAYEKSH